MKCTQCGGLMAHEQFYAKFEDFLAWRCIACGDIVDQVILENRLRQKD